jgi:hypothetical protein
MGLRFRFLMGALSVSLLGGCLQQDALKFSENTAGSKDNGSEDAAKKKADPSGGGSSFLQTACTGVDPVAQPGRVTLRRINKTEYLNTLRDMFDDPALTITTQLPDDNLGYGYDTIGDVLTVSPLLLEKYLSVSDEVLSNNLTAIDPTVNIARHVNAQDAVVTKEVGGAQGTDAWNVWSNGAIYFPQEVTSAGTYTVKVRAQGQLSGPDLPHMEIGVGSNAPAGFDLNTTIAVYTATGVLSKGTQTISVRFTNDFGDPNAAAGLRDRNLVVYWIELSGPAETQAAVKPLAYQKLFTCTPANTAAETPCAQQILGTFARKAYRRPLETGELDSLVAFVTAARAKGDPFDTGIRNAIRAVMLSPKFLYRVEGNMATVTPGAVTKLTDPELATRLAYFLWSSAPDPELLNLAEQKRLSDPATLSAQIKRMLRSPKAAALAKNFAAQWLETRALASITPDAGKFPTFNDQLRADFKTETEQFLTYIIANDRDIHETLDANYSFLNARLAAHYGIPGVTGAEFRQVTLPAGGRRGVLSQGSVLAVTSNPDRTSPTKRGKWVMSKVLCRPPPPPPAGVEGLDNQGATIDPNLPMREKLALHRAKPQCYSCHSVMDPIGFGFEGFNAIGASRTKDEHDNAVDSTGTLPDGRSFSGVPTLVDILKSDQSFAQCLAENLMTFGLGRGMEAPDKCTLEQIGRDVFEGGPEHRKFSYLIERIVMNPAFQTRQAEDSYE